MYEGSSEVFLDNICPENNALQKSSSVSVAPGEGVIPTSILSEKHWDVKSFPCLFPDGNFGLHHQRKVNLTASQFFQQRILNRNPKFSATQKA